MPQLASHLLDDPLREPNRDHGHQDADVRFPWMHRISGCDRDGWKQSESTCNHPMVENAHKATRTCAFLPLEAGLYWTLANNLGAGLSIVLGWVTRIVMEFVASDAALLPQFTALIASALGMLAGSLVAIRK